jgi:transcriptional regulator with XRE-family HTH domain
VPPRRRLKARSPEQAALGDAIRRTRKRAELTQEQLADRAEINAKQIGILERGRGNPSYTTLARVASALELRIGELTTLADLLHDERRLG